MKKLIIIFSLLGIGICSFGQVVEKWVDTDSLNSEKIVLNGKELDNDTIDFAIRSDSSGFADTSNYSLSSLNSMNSLNSINSDSSQYSDTSGYSINSLSAVNSDTSKISDTTLYLLRTTEEIDRTIYVTTTGDDENGDGTIGSPFATPLRAYQDVGDIIERNVNVTILLGNGAYTFDNEGIEEEFLRYIFYDNAHIILESEMILVENGFTLSVRSPESYIYDVSGATFTTNEHQDNFLLVGSDYYGIANNSTNTINAMPGCSAATEIYEPGATINLTSGSLNLGAGVVSAFDQSVIFQHINISYGGFVIFQFGTIVDLLECNIYCTSLQFEDDAKYSKSFTRVNVIASGSYGIQMKVSSQTDVIREILVRKSGTKGGDGIRIPHAFIHLNGAYLYNFTNGIRYYGGTVFSRFGKGNTIFDNCTNGIYLQNNSHFSQDRNDLSIFMDNVDYLLTSDAGFEGNSTIMINGLVGSPNINNLSATLQNYGYSNLERNIHIHIPNISFSKSDTLSVESELYVRDTSIVDLINKYASTSGSYGDSNEIPVVNVAGTGFDYDTNFAYDGTRLTLTDARDQNNVYIGVDVGKDDLGTDYNLAIGWHALQNHTGDAIVAIGKEALLTSTTSSGTVAVGYEALKYGTVNNDGTAVGYQAMRFGGGLGDNTGIGYRALYVLETGGFANTGVGANVLDEVTTGDYNTAVGRQSQNNENISSNNTSIGAHSLYNNVTGDGNTAVGYEAGYTALGGGNVFIGNQAGRSETGADKLYVDNSSTSDPLIYGDFSTDDLKINGDFEITGDLTMKVYSQSTEPDIPTGTIALWIDTDDSSYWIILDIGGTQKKVELN